MKSKMMAQESAVPGEQAAKIHWTVTLTEVGKLFFLCFILNYFMIGNCFIFLLRMFNIPTGFLYTWMFGCLFFFALILPPLTFLMSIIARHIARKPAWSSGRKRAEANVGVGVALMLFWFFAIFIFLA
jgi:hypothetical protein